MDLQTYIDERNLTRYRLSQISGVPKTTITDICSGKSDIGRCSAHTVQQLAKALGCTMEELMEFAPCRKDGRPKDRTYLEHGLPGFLQESLDAMKSAWESSTEVKTTCAGIATIAACKAISMSLKWSR